MRISRLMDNPMNSVSILSALAEPTRLEALRLVGMATNIASAN